MFFQPPHLQSEQFQVSRAAPCFNKLSTVWQEAARRCGCWPAILCKILSGRFAIMASNRAPLPPSGRRVASPRNNSAALLAASMSMGEAVSNSRVGTGTAGSSQGDVSGSHVNVAQDGKGNDTGKSAVAAAPPHIQSWPRCQSERGIKLVPIIKKTTKITGSRESRAGEQAGRIALTRSQTQEPKNPKPKPRNQ